MFEVRLSLSNNKLKISADADTELQRMLLKDFATSIGEIWEDSGYAWWYLSIPLGVHGVQIVKGTIASFRDIGAVVVIR